MNGLVQCAAVSLAKPKRSIWFPIFPWTIGAIGNAIGVSQPPTMSGAGIDLGPVTIELGPNTFGTMLTSIGIAAALTIGLLVAASIPVVAQDKEADILASYQATTMSLTPQRIRLGR